MNFLEWIMLITVGLLWSLPTIIDLRGYYRGIKRAKKIKKIKKNKYKKNEKK